MLEELEKKLEILDIQSKNLEHIQRKAKTKENEVYRAKQELKTQFILDSKILSELNWEFNGYSLEAKCNFSEKLPERITSNLSRVHLDGRLEEGCITHWVALDIYKNSLHIHAYDLEVLKNFIIKNNMKLSCAKLELEQTRTLKAAQIFCEEVRQK